MNYSLISRKFCWDTVCVQSFNFTKKIVSQSMIADIPSINDVWFTNIFLFQRFVRSLVHPCSITFSWSVTCSDSITWITLITCGCLITWICLITFSCSIKYTCCASSAVVVWSKNFNKMGNSSTATIGKLSITEVRILNKKTQQENYWDYLLQYNILSVIATIPLATGNKLNCFISARGMLKIVWHCALVYCLDIAIVFLLI